jgi:hypothetical protein
MLLTSAHQSAAAFNGLFYATTATVIPVLFLAIALQGSTWQRLIDGYGASLRLYRNHIRELREAGKYTRLKVIPVYARAQIALVIICPVIAAGLFGETDSLNALYTQTPAPGVLPATIALLLVVAAIPVVRYMQAVGKEEGLIRQGEARHGLSAEAKSEHPASSAAASPSPGAKGEPPHAEDKADATARRETPRRRRKE